jgi:hypothetical protein
MNATRINTIASGVLTGFVGVEHGFFEILQGNVAPSGHMIEAIGPAQRFWELGTEIAFTIVPSFLVAGILSVTIGLAIMIWSIMFAHKKHGALILTLLTVMMFLSGGGYAMLGSALVAIIMAANINNPHKWLGKYQSSRILRFLAKSWAWILVIMVVVYLYCVGVAIFGWPLTLFFDPVTINDLQINVGLVVFGMMFYLIPAGFAFDVRKQDGAVTA